MTNILWNFINFVMSYILHLETSTKQCSVALSKEGVCISKKKCLDENFSHSEKLHLFIQDVINLAGIVISDLDAIAEDVNLVNNFFKKTIQETK